MSADIIPLFRTIFDPIRVEITSPWNARWPAILLRRLRRE